MVARKPTLPNKTKAPPPRPPSDEARAFGVVLEEVRAHIHVIGEGLQLVQEQQQRMGKEMAAGFAEVHQRFEQVDRRFDEVDRRFDEVDRRFEQVDRRFDQVDGRFDRVEQDIGLLKIAALDHSRELKEIRAALDRKVDRDEIEGIVQRVRAGHR